MWTIAAFALFGIIGPALVKRYEKFLYRSEAPWILQELNAPQSGTERSSRGRAA